MDYFPLKDFFEAWYLCRICVFSMVTRNLDFYCSLTKEKYDYFAYCPAFKVHKPRNDKFVNQDFFPSSGSLTFNIYLFLFIAVGAYNTRWAGFLVFEIIPLFFIIKNYILVPLEVRQVGWFGYLYVLIMKKLLQERKDDIADIDLILKQQIIKIFGYKYLSKFSQLFKTETSDELTLIKKNIGKIDEKGRKRLFALFCQAYVFNNLENFQNSGTVQKIFSALSLKRNFWNIQDFFIDKEKQFQEQINKNKKQSQQEYSKIIYTNNSEKYYEILGLTSKASNTELSRRFKTLAMQYHPDRFVGKSDEELHQAQEKFKEITNAYNEIKKIRHF